MRNAYWRDCVFAFDPLTICSSEELNVLERLKLNVRDERGCVFIWNLVIL